MNSFFSVGNRLIAKSNLNVPYYDSQFKSVKLTANRIYTINRIRVYKGVHFYNIECDNKMKDDFTYSEIINLFDIKFVIRKKKLIKLKILNERE